MIRVGFLLKASHLWIGGFNYYRNLLFALSAVNKSTVEPIVFLGTQGDPTFANEISEFVKIQKVRFLDKWSPTWIIWKVSKFIFNSDFILNVFLAKYNIDIFSHSSVVNIPGVKTLNWIPDFQHLHLPEMFSKKEIKRRDQLFLNLAKHSDGIIVSSQSASKDLLKMISPNTDKIHILKFVGYPSKLQLSMPDEDYFLRKHAIEKHFFYLPNQFWKHKNHLVVCEALKILKAETLTPQVICSGFAGDFRNRSYFGELKNFVNDHQLNIKFIGLVSCAEVTYLMMNSVAVINPSLFEGWSTTVEECKSLGKNMILSDIEVHREQNPANSQFFDPCQPKELAHLLRKALSVKSTAKCLYDSTRIDQAIQRFGIDFCNILTNLKQQ